MYSPDLVTWTKGLAGKEGLFASALCPLINSKNFLSHAPHAKISLSNASKIRPLHKMLSIKPAGLGRQLWPASIPA